MGYAVYPSVSSKDGRRYHYVIDLTSRFRRIAEILNQTSIINTLTLGLYFGVVSTLDTGYWDSLESALETSGCNERFSHFYFNVRNSIISGVVCSALAVMITFLHYFKPPDDVKDCQMIKKDNFPIKDVVHLASKSALHTEGVEMDMKTGNEATSSESSPSTSKEDNSSSFVRLSPAEATALRAEFESVWEEFSDVYIEFLEFIGYTAVFCTYISIVSLLILLGFLYQFFSVPTRYLCSASNYRATVTGGIIFGVFSCLALCAMKIGYGVEMFPATAARWGFRTSRYYPLCNFVVYLVPHFLLLFIPVYYGVLLGS